MDLRLVEVIMVKGTSLEDQFGTPVKEDISCICVTVMSRNESDERCVREPYQYSSTCMTTNHTYSNKVGNMLDLTPFFYILLPYTNLTG